MPPPLYPSTTYAQGCSNPTATIPACGQGGIFSSTIGLSIDASTGMINLAASTLGTYLVRYSSGATCSTTATVTITAALVQPLVSVVQPTSCLLATGSVTVTSSLSGGSYTLVGVGATAGVSLTSTLGVFIGLAPGSYSLRASLNGCVSAAAAITINPAPTAALALPIAVVVQPTCLVATGSLTVTAAVSGGTYTLVGVGVSLTSNTGVFTNLAPGTYSLRVALNGCISAAVAVTINAAPTAPSAPVIAVIVQPTSLVATGSLTVSSPISDGTYTLVGVGLTAGVSLTSTTGVFTNLAAGTYSLRVALNGCISAAVAVTINAAPTAPSAPVVVVVQPTCLVATGSLTVTAAISGGTYTLVGVGATAGVTLTSNTGVFTNLAAGSYSLRVALNGLV
ncbi:hypothetical protein, partial [Hymenobacter roseosalivarius]|uniref:hypothetical protein n=1 Tax=Hymenobacter roseosalivarius TaxID=89967 RepID=UPI00373FCD7E